MGRIGPRVCSIIQVVPDLCAYVFAYPALESYRRCAAWR